MYLQKRKENSAENYTEWNLIHKKTRKQIEATSGKLH